MALRSADVCIEVHGGNGFTEEYGFLDMYNGARLLKTAPVSREMILNFVSEWDLGLPRSYEGGGPRPRRLRVNRTGC